MKKTIILLVVLLTFWVGATYAQVSIDPDIVDVNDENEVDTVDQIPTVDTGNGGDATPQATVTVSTNVGIDDDVFEPNNSDGDASLIGVGTISDLTLSNNDQDWFVIDSKDGDIFEIKTAVINGTDTKLSVYKDGSLIAQNDDQSNSNRGSQVVVNPGFGRIYILIEYVGVGGEYSLTINLIEPTAEPTKTATPTAEPTATIVPTATALPLLDSAEPNDTLQTAFEIVPGHRGSYYLGSDDPVDVYNMYGKSGNNYRCVTVSNSVDTKVSISNVTGILAENDDRSSTEIGSLVEWQQEADEIIYITVTVVGGSGDYELSCVVIVDDVVPSPVPDMINPDVSATAAPTLTPIWQTATPIPWTPATAAPTLTPIWQTATPIPWTPATAMPTPTTWLTATPIPWTPATAVPTLTPIWQTATPEPEDAITVLPISEPVITPVPTLLPVGTTFVAAEPTISSLDIGGAITNTQSEAITETIVITGTDGVTRTETFTTTVEQATIENRTYPSSYQPFDMVYLGVVDDSVQPEPLTETQYQIEVFYDASNDLKKGPNEGIANVPLWLINNDGIPVKLVTTNQNGQALFLADENAKRLIAPSNPTWSVDLVPPVQLGQQVVTLNSFMQPAMRIPLYLPVELPTPTPVPEDE